MSFNSGESGQAAMGKLREGILSRARFARAQIRDGKPLWIWLTIAFTLLAISYAIIPGDLSTRVRSAGMFFQFTGLATVVWGLNKSRKLFNRPPIWTSAARWLKGWWYIIKPRELITASVDIALQGMGIAATGVVVHPASSGTLEDRVTKLEADLKRIDEDLSHTNRRISELDHQTTERMGRERADRETGDRRIGEQLEAATIGGISLELAGLSYLYVGIAFTSVPSEIASILRCLGI